MKFLEKHLLLLFLIANATAEYVSLMFVSKYLFYAVLALSVPIIISKNVFAKSIRAQCPQIYIMMAIYLIAQFLLQPDMINSQTLTYTIGKVVTFCIVMFCVSHNFEYYFKQTIRPLSYLILGLLLVGWFINKGGISVDNYITFGFANRNAACTLGSIGFAGFLFTSKKCSFKEYMFMSFLLITILIGGSRNALAMCLLFIIIKYGLSEKLVFASLFCIFIIVYVLPEFGLEAVALDRLEGTLSGTVSLDREDQREAAKWMIMQRPWTGWGYNHENIGYALALTEYGAHNGYLTTLKNLGIPLGIMLLFTIIWTSLKNLKLYKLHNMEVNYHLAVIISILLAANFEDFLVGVNQITTNIFFLSFVVLNIYRYRYGYKNKPN